MAGHGGLPVPRRLGWPGRTFLATAVTERGVPRRMPPGSQVMLWFADGLGVGLKLEAAPQSSPPGGRSGSSAHDCS